MNRRWLVAIETMETRCLLSHALLHTVHARHATAPALKQHPVTHSVKHPQQALGPRASPSSPVASQFKTSDLIPYSNPGPFQPAQLRHFYGVDSIAFNGIAGTGAGQTIAIIDCFDQPNLQDSSSAGFAGSDLNLFDQEFGLPAPPSFLKIPEHGQTALPTATEPDWEGEEDLDVEWAHAMAPQASIVLIECASEDDAEVFTDGTAAAKNYPGVSVVSMSFGSGPEDQVQDEEQEYDPVFSSSATNPGITWLASAGDQGAYNTGYPALSPHVVAVGGTSAVSLDGNGTYGLEAVWNNSAGATGGIASQYEPKPGYQANVSTGGSFRGTPDVSFDADPASGVPVVINGYTFSYYGGTSLSSPCWAGLIAIANQGRSLAGLGALDGFSQTLPRLYDLTSADFHDITMGDNGGSAAGPGYDLASGLGTPVANLLVPDLAGGDSISGRVFLDNNGNGTFDTGETPLVGQTVYLDVNNSGTPLSGDPTAITDATGTFTFPDEIGGLTGTVRLVSAPVGDVLTTAPAAVSTGYAQTQTLNLGLFPTNYSTAAAGASYTISLDRTGTDLLIDLNGQLTDTAPVSIIPSLAFFLTGSGDSLTIDGTNGNPVPSGGISFNGAPAGDLLTVIGTAGGNDVFTVNLGSINFGNNPIAFTNVSKLLLNTGSGIDALTVNSGSVTIPASSAGIVTRNFSSISIATNAQAVFATASVHSNRTLVEAASVSTPGQLDLGGNDMIVHNGNLTFLTNLLAAGYSNGTWAGQGIACSAAGADPAHLTALGIVSNNIGNGTALFGGLSQSLFDGQAPLPSDVLIKYTYYGDTNLSGSVDGSDYTRIDNALLMHQTGWFNGDFNYDTHIDGSDYTLLDNAFNTQTSVL